MVAETRLEYMFFIAKIAIQHDVKVPRHVCFETI